MPKNKSQIHVVEFWPKPFKEVMPLEILQTTECDSAAGAIALESSFHAIGWPARALALTNRIERVNLTSNRTESKA